jgi:hypothetical protein
MNKLQFDCLRTFFYAVNSLRGSLRVSSSGCDVSEVIKYDLEGLDTLWNLILVVPDNTDDRVFFEVRKLFTELHVRVRIDSRFINYAIHRIDFFV